MGCGFLGSGFHHVRHGPVRVQARVLLAASGCARPPKQSQASIRFRSGFHDLRLVEQTCARFDSQSGLLAGSEGGDGGRATCTICKRAFLCREDRRHRGSSAAYPSSRAGDSVMRPPSRGTPETGSNLPRVPLDGPGFSPGRVDYAVAASSLAVGSATRR